MNKDLFFMQEAIEEAKLGLDEGEVPVGAVLTLNDEIIAKEIVEKSLINGLILFYFLFTKTAIRITPPLTISDNEIIKGCNIIKKILDS